MILYHPARGGIRVTTWNMQNAGRVVAALLNVLTIAILSHHNSRVHATGE